MSMWRHICAVVTPFMKIKGENVIDYDSLGEHLAWLESKGVDAVVIAGTTGESATLSFEEHEELLRQAVKLTPLSVIAGAGGNSTAEAIHLTKCAEKDGVAAVLSVVPYYNKPNQEGLRQHFGAICRVTSLPVILYNVPGRTVVSLKPETTLRIREENGNCAGIKEASSDLKTVEIYVENNFPVWCGEDAMNFPMLCLGARGVISVVSNFAPIAISGLISCFPEDGKKVNLALARKWHAEVSRYAEAAFIDTNPIPTKAILAKMSFCKNILRLPLVPLDAEKSQKVYKALRVVGRLA